MRNKTAADYSMGRWMHRFWKYLIVDSPKNVYRTKWFSCQCTFLPSLEWRFTWRTVLVGCMSWACYWVFNVLQVKINLRQRGNERRGLHGEFGFVKRLESDNTKGLPLIVIIVALWGLLESHGMDVRRGVGFDWGWGRMRDDGKGGVQVCVHMLQGWWEFANGIFTLAMSRWCLRMLYKVERSEKKQKKQVGGITLLCLSPNHKHIWLSTQIWGPH